MTATATMIPGKVTQPVAPPVVAARKKKAGTACVDIAARVASLASLTRDQLVAEWRRLYRSSPPERVRRDLLELGVAWKIQEKALGGLKKGVASELKRMAEDLATHGEIRKVHSPTVKPGARLIREWGGVTHEVIVLDEGYLFRNQTFASLSAIAAEITGAHWSGPRFFGLARRKAGPSGAEQSPMKALDGEMQGFSHERPEA